LAKPGINLTIVDSSLHQSCSGNCGKDWSINDTLHAARQRIRERFGDRVKLEYLDMAKAKNFSKTKRIKAIVGEMPLPVLLTNDRPRIAGEFDLRQLMDVIETDLEVNCEQD
jgi:hypothetical protein